MAFYIMIIAEAARFLNSGDVIIIFPIWKTALGFG